MRKVLSLAAAGLLAAGAAQAGTLTVANSDITLYGGVSASYDWQNNDIFARTVYPVFDGTGAYLNDGNPTTTFNRDNFYVSTFAIGLMKKADANSPIGFNAAFASFTVPTLVASSTAINSGGLIASGSTNSFQPWLAYVTIAPVEGLSLDAGLLWNKFGEAPLTILNQHYTRGILFTGHPVLYAGARVNYDAGVAKVYVGYNQGGGLRQGSGNYIATITPSTMIDIGYNIRDAFEAGVMADLGMAKVGLHTYNESKGRDLYVACVKADAGVAKVGLEIDYTKLDDAAKIPGADSSAWGFALNIDPVVAPNISIPIRIEYVDNGDGSNQIAPGTDLGSFIKALGSGVYLTGENSAWSFTITPTYKPTKNTFARLEAAYISTDKKIFVDDKENAKDNRTVLAFEAGFLF